MIQAIIGPLVVSQSITEALKAICLQDFFLRDLGPSYPNQRLNLPDFERIK